MALEITLRWINAQASENVTQLHPPQGRGPGWGKGDAINRAFQNLTHVRRDIY